MKKHSQKSAKNRSQTSKDDASITAISPQVSKAKSLSLIFSKLAEFEDQRLDEDFFRLLGNESDFEVPTINMSEELAKLTSTMNQDIDSTEQLRLIQNTFRDKLNLLKELDSKISPALVTCRAIYKKKDLMILEKLRTKQDIDASEVSYQEKADLCRNLQSRNKEYEATSKLLLIEEVKKTEELRAKCIDSISSITMQIEDEEAAVLTKKEENDSLAVKIAEFNSHLVIRDEHLITQRKARAVEQQLIAAKIIQHQRAEEQRALDSKSYRSHILQLIETQKDLERQVELYVEKASSFEATLDDTKSVFQQFEDRASTMMREVEEIDEELSKQDTVKAEKKDLILKMQQYIVNATRKTKSMAEDDIPAIKCRELQARRTELTKDLARMKPSPAVLGHAADIDHNLAAESSSINRPEAEDLLDDRPSEEVVDTRSGRTSPHVPDASWVPNLLSSSSSRSCSTPPSSSSRNWTEAAAKENTAGEDTPVSSPSVHSPKRGEI